MNQPPVLGICAQASGMGKTTLLTRLLPLLAEYGIRASVIKQTCDGFDLDRPGKDSLGCVKQVPPRCFSARHSDGHC